MGVTWSKFAYSAAGTPNVDADLPAGHVMIGHVPSCCFKSYYELALHGVADRRIVCTVAPCRGHERMNSWSIFDDDEEDSINSLKPLSGKAPEPLPLPLPSGMLVPEPRQLELRALNPFDHEAMLAALQVAGYTRLSQTQLPFYSTVPPDRNPVQSGKSADAPTGLAAPASSSSATVQRPRPRTPASPPRKSSSVNNIAVAAAPIVRRVSDGDGGMAAAPSVSHLPSTSVFAHLPLGLPVVCAQLSDASLAAGKRARETDILEAICAALSNALRWGTGRQPTQIPEQPLLVTHLVTPLTAAQRGLASAFVAQGPGRLALQPLHPLQAAAQRRAGGGSGGGASHSGSSSWVTHPVDDVILSSRPTWIDRSLAEQLNCLSERCPCRGATGGSGGLGLLAGAADGGTFSERSPSPDLFERGPGPPSARAASPQPGAARALERQPSASGLAHSQPHHFHLLLVPISWVPPFTLRLASPVATTDCYGKKLTAFTAHVSAGGGLFGRTATCWQTAVRRRDVERLVRLLQEMSHNGAAGLSAPHLSPAKRGGVLSVAPQTLLSTPTLLSAPLGAIAPQWNHTGKGYRLKHGYAISAAAALAGAHALGRSGTARQRRQAESSAAAVPPSTAAPSSTSTSSFTASSHMQLRLLAAGGGAGHGEPILLSNPLAAARGASAKQRTNGNDGDNLPSLLSHAGSPSSAVASTTGSSGGALSPAPNVRALQPLFTSPGSSAHGKSGSASTPLAESSSTSSEQQQSYALILSHAGRYAPLTDEYHHSEGDDWDDSEGGAVGGGWALLASLLGRRPEVPFWEARRLLLERYCQQALALPAVWGHPPALEWLGMMQQSVLPSWTGRTLAHTVEDARGSAGASARGGGAGGHGGDGKIARAPVPASVSAPSQLPPSLPISQLLAFVRPGDVVLFSCDNTPSALQRGVTRCDWDHVGVVVDEAWRETLALDERLGRAEEAAAAAAAAAALSWGSRSQAGAGAASAMSGSAPLPDTGDSAPSTSFSDPPASAQSGGGKARRAAVARFFGVSEDEAHRAVASELERVAASGDGDDYHGGGDDGDDGEPPLVRSGRASRSASVLSAPGSLWAMPSADLRPLLVGPSTSDLPSASASAAGQGVSPAVGSDAGGFSSHCSTPPATPTLAGSPQPSPLLQQPHTYSLQLLEATGEGVRVYPLRSRLAAYGSEYCRAIAIRRLLLPGEEEHASMEGAGGCDDPRCCVARRPGAAGNPGLPRAASTARGTAARTACACTTARRLRVSLERRLASFMAEVQGLPYRLSPGKLLGNVPAHMVTVPPSARAPALQPSLAATHALAAAVQARPHYYCSELLAAAYQRCGLLPLPPSARHTGGSGGGAGRALFDPAACWPNAWVPGGPVEALLPPGARLDRPVLLDPRLSPLR